MNILRIIDNEGANHEYQLISALIKPEKIVCALNENEKDALLTEWIQGNWDAHYYRSIEKNDFICNFKNPLRILSVDNESINVITFTYSVMN